MSLQKPLVFKWDFPHIFNKNRCLQPNCMVLKYKFARVKQVLNILMAAYIAFVACYPCNDSDICIDDKKSASLEVSIWSHEHSPDELDLCSPFCICNCCSSSINQPKYFYFTFFTPKIEGVNFPVKPSTVKTISHSIWQPPRLA